MSVPKHRQKEHSYQFIANARKIRKLLLIAIKRLDNTENAVDLFYRQRLLLYSSQMTYNIRMAYNIYVKTDLDFKCRRMYQNRAICIVNLLMEEINYLFELSPKYSANFISCLETLEKERQLLRGWLANSDKIKLRFIPCPEYEI